MKILTLSIALIMSLLTFGQDDMFTIKMKEALAIFDKCETPQDFEKVTINFEQIASVETTNWLPKYYEAMSYTLASYSEKQENSTQKDLYLDEAEKVFEDLKSLAPEEAEVYALEGFYFTARLIVNPMARGMKYSSLSNKSIEKALVLDADNPRAKQLKIANAMGMAQFFGKDTKQECENANTLLNEWDNYKLRSDIHPSWGKNYLESIVKSCNSDDTETKEVLEKAESSKNTTESKNSYTLTVNISELISDTGVVLIKLVDENEKEIKNAVGKINNNKSTITFTNLKTGTYAVQFFHDANGNMKFDMGSRGPEEGYGYSNNAKGFMSAPKFNKQKIEVKNNLTIELITRN